MRRPGRKYSGSGRAESTAYKASPHAAGMVKKGGARAGLFLSCRACRDISNHYRQKKSRNTDLETCAAHGLSSLCSIAIALTTSREAGMPFTRGYPAWIRTKNNASKGRCVTVTPRGKIGWPIYDFRRRNGSCNSRDEELEIAQGAIAACRPSATGSSCPTI